MIINAFDGLTTSHSLEKDFLAGLETYLDQVWAERPLIYTDESYDRDTGQQFLELSYNGLKAKRYVGLIQYKGLRINVYPRVFYEPDIKNLDQVVAIKHVLKWLSYCHRIHFPVTDIQINIGGAADWLEALIYLFASYTERILNSAPHLSYEEITEEMQFVRGRIAMEEYIGHNLVKGKFHSIQCTHNPFVFDNLFNRIVKYTLRRLLSFTSNNRNIQLLDAILFTLDEVSDVPCTGADCDRINANRLYPEVDIIRNFCKMFLQHQNIHSSQSHENTLCILLPMETIFEQYVAGFINGHFPGWNSRIQASDEFLASRADQLKVFQLRHDILLPGKMIIDTKYKFRREDPAKRGVSQSDMYQMVSYCLKRNIQRGFLLYPFNPENIGENTSETFIVKTPSFSTTISVASIDISEFDLSQFDKLQKEKFSRLLA